MTINYVNKVDLHHEEYFMMYQNKGVGVMTIFDSSRQSNATNRCVNAFCSHLCLPNGLDSHRCVCPLKEFLQPNNVCKDESKYNIYNIMFSRFLNIDLLSTNFIKYDINLFICMYF